MMTKEDYELRLTVANDVVSEARANGNPRLIELAEQGLAALNQQWYLSALYIKQKQAVAEQEELLADRERLEWMIRREAQVWKHPNECFYTVSTGDENDYYGDTPRQAINECMKQHP